MANMVIGNSVTLLNVRISFQSVSAGNSHGRNGAGRQRRDGSDGDLHRDAVRQHFLKLRCTICIGGAGAQRGSRIGLSNEVRSEVRK